MSMIARGFGRIALSLSLMAAALPASAQAPAAPAAAISPEILPVPLNPIVPAAQRQCSATTGSGLGTRVLKEAPGAKPGTGDYVLVNYIGYLAASGTVFDQNVSQAFSTGAVIKGFSEGLLLMNKGSVWRFCIPAAQGYGAQASGPIPANSDLVFQVELIDFKTAAEVNAMRSQAGKGAAQAAGTGTKGD